MAGRNEHEAESGEFAQHPDVGQNSGNTGDLPNEVRNDELIAVMTRWIRAMAANENQRPELPPRRHEPRAIHEATTCDIRRNH